jgi:hypothetical protein
LEILGGLGLILPGLTKIQTRLTPFAAVGLALVIIAAAIWHIQRGEFANTRFNIGNIFFLTVLAYGRWKLVPLQDRSSAETI